MSVLCLIDSCFLENNGILSNFQFGFRKNSSPQVEITQLINNVLQNQASGKFTVSVFLDLKKAFDILDHKILLKKLQYYGIRNSCLGWFSSYLNNRSQCTLVNSSYSHFENVITGVPQGSTLGPILFLIYINDIVESSSILKYILFADDTNISHSDANLDSLTRIINIELKSVTNWLLANKLSLNVEKAKYVIFAGNKPFNDNFNIEMCNKNVMRTCKLKYLGIFIDQHLTWKDHISHIHSKISKSSGILYKVKNIVPQETLKLLYYTLIYPYLQYCNVVWGMATKSSTNSLVLLQKRVIRLITNVNFYEHTNPLFKNLGILKFNDIYVLECLKLIYEQIHINNSLNIQQASDLHCRATRNRYLLRPVFPRTETQKRFVTYFGCVKWNELPTTIQDCNNKVSFKINAKKLIISNY